MKEYCDAAIRIKVREDLEKAIDLVETFERPYRPGHVFDGAFALFARLVRQDAPFGGAHGRSRQARGDALSSPRNIPS